MFKWLSSILVIVALAACVSANVGPLPRKPKPPTQPATQPTPQPQPNAPAGG